MARLAREDGDGGAPKRFGANRRGIGIGDEVRDKRGLSALRLGRPRRRNDEERQSLEPSRQVEEPPQGRGVAPVQVVERKKRRLLKGDVRREPVEAMEDREGSLAVPFWRSDQSRSSEEPFHERRRS